MVIIPTTAVDTSENEKVKILVELAEKDNILKANEE